MLTSSKDVSRSNRPNKRWIRPCLAGLVFLIFAMGMLPQDTVLHSQEPQDADPFARTVDQIPQLGVDIFLFNDMNVVVKDITTLFEDVGARQFIFFANSMFKMESGKGFDPTAGVFLVFGRKKSSWSHVLVAYGIVDKDTASKTLGLKLPLNKTTDYKHLEGNGPRITIFSLLGTSGGSDGFFSEDRWWSFNYPLEEDFQTWIKKIKDAKPLVDSLHPQAHKMLLTSGMSMINEERQGLELLIPSDGIDFDFKQPWTDHEQMAIDRLSSLEGKRVIGGLKYQQHVLEARIFGQLEDGNELDELFDLEAAAISWNPDLGLEKEDLVLASSFQMSAFRSSALPRFMPRLLLSSQRRNQSLSFLNGNMLASLTELIGDSWNDLAAARVAVYQNNPDQAELGQFCIFGIVDTDQPEVVLEELQRISIITAMGLEPDAQAIQQAEINRLVRQLQSDDLNLAARAETRLALGRNIAKSSLAELAASNNETWAKRAKRVLAKIKKRQSSDSTKLPVEDPMFWSTLNPVLTFQPAVASAGDQKTHTIAIAPDPSKSEADVLAASSIMKLMFGNDWNKITVIQMPGHFVFMIGSDQARLERIVANIQIGSSNLRAEFDGIGNGNKQGLFHAFADMERIKSLYDSYSSPESNSNSSKRGIDDYLDPDPKLGPPLVWAGGHVFQDHLEMWVLLPANQIRPFLKGWY